MSSNSFDFVFDAHGRCAVAVLLEWWEANWWRSGGDGPSKCIRNRWGPGLVEPPGESWPLLLVSQIGVANLNVRVCSLLLRLPTVRPPVRLRIIGPAFGFENH